MSHESGPKSLFKPKFVQTRNILKTRQTECLLILFWNRNLKNKNKKLKLKTTQKTDLHVPTRRRKLRWEVSQKGLRFWTQKLWSEGRRFPCTDGGSGITLMERKRIQLSKPSPQGEIWCREQPRSVSPRSLSLALLEMLLGGVLMLLGLGSSLGRQNECWETRRGFYFISQKSTFVNHLPCSLNHPTVQYNTMRFT